MGFGTTVKQYLKKVGVNGVVYFLAILAYISPFWLFTYIPTEDGTSHLGNAYTIREFADAGATRIHEFLRLNPQPQPNIGYHYIIAGLMFVVPPLLAEKIVLSLYVIVFLLALRSLATAFHGRFHAAVFLAFPLVIAYPFQLGLFNFVIALALAAVALAIYWKRRDAVGVWGWALFNVAAVLVFLCHLLGWAILITGISALAFTDGAITFAKTKGRPAAGGLKTLIYRRFLVPLYLLPAIIPGVYYYVTQPRLDEPVRFPLAQLTGELLTLRNLVLFNKYQLFNARATALCLGLLLAAALAAKTYASLKNKTWGGWNRTDAVIIGGVVLTTALYFYVPDSTPFRGNGISVRLALLPAFGVVLFLAGVQLPFFRKAAWVLGLLVAASHLFGSVLGYDEANRILKVYNSGRCAVAENSTILSIHDQYLPTPDSKVYYTKHAAPYYAITTKSVILNNYEPNYAYFPVQWREPEKLPELKGYNQGTPLYDVHGDFDRVDYVICWRINPFIEEMRVFFCHYDVVHATAHLIVLKRRDRPPRAALGTAVTKKPRKKKSLTPPS